MGFQVGDKVVYPSQGVTIVESIVEEDLAGMMVECYHLRLLATDSKVLVPVQNIDRVGLRPLCDSSDVSESLDRLRANVIEQKSDWKDRYKANLERLKTGELGEVVDVLLCLADVASRKTLSFRERKMFDQAQQILAHEVAEVEHREVDEVSHEIDDILTTHMGSEDAGDSEE
jgi:CarD family transcriptional regulator